MRLARKYAIDREGIVDKVLKGYGRVGNDQPITPSLPCHDPSIQARDCDPDKATFYLKKSDLTSLEVDLHTADAAFNGAVDTCVLFSETAKAAGIEIRVVREPDDGYFSNVWLKEPFVTSYWGGRPTADLQFSIAYGSDAEWNESHFENDRFDTLLMRARGELDEEKRADTYREMQRIVADEGSTIIPVYNQYIAAMNKRVRTPDAVTQMMALDSIRYIERWWMA